ncbi:HAD-IIIA family hydrolase [Eggerthella sp. YY7918]|uniref:HAD-IIIA family hydrolase n=1 Tax=Eggerthella sp. (strain YY7918) TaxID=502558 RepID=UPI0002170FD7|nr:HAD-IIIA family hydrolase [Eggerthella sp. YY7918]BAK43919.1 nucleoside-diphosphate-sugar pyrophosphorylase involved in lipopolysaccharide biosynthesis [Eggerthella sp. YY7918]
MKRPYEILAEAIDRYPNLKPCAQAMEEAFGVLARSYRSGRKVLVCGNGGSASDAEHIVGELMKSFKEERSLPSSFFDQFSVVNPGVDPPGWLEGALPTISLVSQTSLMTAFSNDESAAGVFAQQVYGYGRPGDTLIAISTSGTSPNCVHAARVARTLGMKVVVLTGSAPSPLSEISDVAIMVPETETYRIQELHLPVYHALCAALEAEFFCESLRACFPVREAVVLVGGRGTRLRSVVSDVPKPMAPVNGKPFLHYVLEKLCMMGLERIVLAIGYKGNCIKEYFGSSFQGMEIVYSQEAEPLGTGGAIKKALQNVHNEWAYVLNGDTYQDIDAEKFASYASYAQVKAVLGTRVVQDCSRYGTIDVSKDGRIEAFREKMPVKNGRISSGVYLMRKDALFGMPSVFSLESNWLEPLAPSGVLGAVDLVGSFIDIGIPKDYEQAQSVLPACSKRPKLAFFDRDGTINVDTGHLFQPEELELIPETVDLMRSYNRRGDWRVVVVTNQAGIAKGLYDEPQMHRLHAALDKLLAAKGASVDAYYFCPHHPDYTGPCECRKPAAGLLQKALHEFGAIPSECMMYGDKDTDRLAAEAAGVPFVWIQDVLEKEALQ